jgi:hypothetical protein
MNKTLPGVLTGVYAASLLLGAGAAANHIKNTTPVSGPGSTTIDFGLESSGSPGTLLMTDSQGNSSKVPFQSTITVSATPPATSSLSSGKTFSAIA